ncbi:MAG: PDZ domain-containing protein [Dehalococcoidia bacterium]|nr:PDZ domain-containing protein [Dehalococcoidia bacterium]
MNEQNGRARLPLLLAVAGSLGVAAGALGFGLWNEANADDNGGSGAQEYRVDRERAHEHLDRALDVWEDWRRQHGDGLPAMPGFAPGMMPGGMPFDLEALEGFGVMMRGGPLLGVSVDDALAVTAVAEGSAAEDAGVQVGDRIVKVAGEPVADLAAVRAAIAAVEPGATYDLTVERDGREQTLHAVRPATPAFDLESLMPWLHEHLDQMPRSGPMTPGTPRQNGAGPSGGANSY